LMNWLLLISSCPLKLQSLYVSWPSWWV
jgi:hypothetical protein